MTEHRIQRPAMELDNVKTTRSVAMGRQGAVTSPHYLASQVGQDIIKAGGHAVEAAIATNITLTVVYPHMSGLGGDLMALVYDQANQEVIEINGTGPATANVSIADFENVDEIPERGPQAVLTIPGAVRSWEQLHQRFGRLEWARLFDTAIDYAENGFPVSKEFARYLQEEKSLLEKNADAKNIYFPGGKDLVEGDLLIQTDLGQSLRLIQEQGADAFYEGEIAEKIIASLEGDGGFLTQDDLKNYQPDFKDPIHSSYHDVQVWQTRPNTQGAVAILILNILDNFDLKAIGDNSPEYYHLMAEATKLAFQYRDKYITDEENMDIDVSLLTKDHLGKELADLIQFDGVSENYVDPADLPHFKSSGDTVYLATADSEGNVCSLIQSIYHEFGSGYMPEATGFFLQNRGSSFELDPEHPNRLEAGKYPFHTIIPALMTRDGYPLMAYGTMGGEGQPQTQAALATRVLDFAYNIQQAIDAPRWLYGRTWGDDSDSFKLEGRISDEVFSILESLGHEVEIFPDRSDEMGHAQGITVDPDTGIYAAGADPRGDGSALAW